ncbi:molybdopterin-synthase adenylyltransferase MoeB [Brachybacterium sp. AOP43-C2-M15]|uniref:molybdopterin-synthase adenylyltransferase MoeB n=1 Tax=Brachybacterium sp. AOP43-C2-M15 TaxID=3457661 RepID=UPI004033808B
MTHPPLVEPGPELRPDQIDRYRRQITLAAIGTLGQRRLRAARVLVVGAGGLGTPALQYLAGAGIGTLAVVDDDVVDLSNLHRQVIHGTEGLGTPKVDSAADAVRRINPEVSVETHRTRLDAENVVELVRGHDVVLDGSDNFATRYLVADASEITGVPVVWGAVLRHHGQVSVFWPGRSAHYRDVFPEPPAPGEAPSCAEAGVIGTLPGMIGTVMASQVVQLVTGTGRPLVGTLMLWDEATSSTRSLRIARDPDRAPATRVEVPAAADPSCRSGGPTQEETLDVPALRRLLDGGVTLVDVREPWETAAGTIDGAHPIPLGEVLDRGAEALPGGVGGGEVVLFCQGGVRSAQALERLRPAWSGREGHLRHLQGGYAAWSADSSQP